MYRSHLISFSEAAGNLGVSEAVVQKFIKMGLIVPVNDGLSQKLTSYGLRRLSKALDLYEKSYSPERIESLINH